MEDSSQARRRILAAVRQIPRGYVSTYGAVAKASGRPRGARQVAQALHRSIGVPWHRVLGAGGQIKLGGEAALEQRFRLQTEGVTFRGKHVDMRQHEFTFPKHSKKPTRRRTNP